MKGQRVEGGGGRGTDSNLKEHLLNKTRHPWQVRAVTDTNILQAVEYKCK